MKTRHFLGILTCGFTVFAGCGKKTSDGSGSDDPTEYAIEVRIPGEGSTVRGTFKIDIQMSMDVRDPNGKPVPEAKGQDIKEEIGYRETIETFPDGAKKPTGSRILVDKWEKGKGAAGYAKEGVMSRIVGREIRVEKDHGFYQISAVDGGPIDGDVRLFIDKRYSDFYESFNILDFLPGKPVKKYISWDIPIKQMVKALGQAVNFPFDQEKSKGTAWLTSAFEKDGRKYGRMELTANIVPKFPAEFGVKEVKMDLKWTVELCIDGSKHDVQATANIDTSVDFSSVKEGSGKISVKGTVAIMETEEKIGKAAKPSGGKKDLDSNGGRDNVFPLRVGSKPAYAIPAEEKSSEPPFQSPVKSPGGSGGKSGSSGSKEPPFKSPSGFDGNRGKRPFDEKADGGESAPAAPPSAKLKLPPKSKPFESEEKPTKSKPFESEEKPAPPPK